MIPPFISFYISHDTKKDGGQNILPLGGERGGKNRVDEMVHIKWLCLDSYEGPGRRDLVLEDSSVDMK